MWNMRWSGQAFLVLEVHVACAARDVVTARGCGRFAKFHRIFVGPRPWHIEIRHRVKRTSTINLFGVETLKLKIRRLKLWKPTVRREVGWWSTVDLLHCAYVLLLCLLFVCVCLY